MKTKLNSRWIAGAMAAIAVLVLIPSAHCQSQQDIIPVIKFTDVPITEGIKNLARQAGINNFMIEPNIFKQPEPTVSFRWENITAKSALERMLKEQGLFIVENPQTGVAHISNTNLPPRKFDEDFIGSGTNAVIPLIAMDSVSLKDALVNLVRMSKGEIEIDPKLATSLATSTVYISVRLQNLTPKQVLAAICENYNLQIIKDEKSGVWRISPY
jgi:type II secretory pathway component GspD/PulD (secretin)